MREEKHLAVHSPVFRHGGELPNTFTCDGENRLPALSWGEPPPGTRSFAIVVDDPDAPRRFFVHWLAWNLPATARGVAEDDLPRIRQGRNGFGEVGWGGPCPPREHGGHTYRFLVFALDEELELPEGASRQDLDEALRDHVIARGELHARYRRQPRHQPEARL